MGYIKTTDNQYRAKDTVMMDSMCFADNGDTCVYWLGGAGVMLNTHGTVLLIDPVLGLKGTEPYTSELNALPLLDLPPILAEDIPRANGILYTHIDEDHMGRDTVRALNQKGFHFYGTPFTCDFLRTQSVPEERLHRCRVGGAVQIGSCDIHLTPCLHSWQLDHPEMDWHYKYGDCCGFRITSCDGTIWIPGDSRLLKEHLEMGHVDLLFFDVSEDAWHFGLEGAVKLFNAYPEARKVLYHCGTFCAPEQACHNGDPNKILPRLESPGTLLICAPGEKIIL